MRIERHRAHCHTLEAANLQTALLAHFANLAVATLVDGQAQLRADFVTVNGNNRCRTDAVAVNLHRLCEFRDVFQIAAHAHLIVLFHLVARMGQRVEQIAVVGQQQQTLGVVVQTADRHDTRTAAAYQIGNRLAAVLVLHGGDVTARLVQH